MPKLRKAGLEEKDISALYTNAGHTITAGLVDGAVLEGVVMVLVHIGMPHDLVNRTGGHFGERQHVIDCS